MTRIVSDVPELNLPTDNGSETDTSNTDRSTATPKSVTSIDSGLAQDPRKPRKSMGRSNAKRSQTKFGPQKKNFKSAAEYKGKSKFSPRILPLMRTPSSSSESASAFSSARSNARLAGAPPSTPAKADTPHPLAKRAGGPSSALVVSKVHRLARPQSALFNFRDRKAITAMDFKEHVRRNGMATTSSPNAKAVMMAGAQLKVLSSGQTGVNVAKKLFHEEDYYYVVQGRDPKMAGMRIFSTIMLNAWRKRRDQVKTMTEEVNDLKGGLSKTKSQVYVYSALFQVEKKHNADLQIQIRKAGEELKSAKESIDNLELSLAEMKIENNSLEDKLLGKEREHENLSLVLADTRAELFQAMAEQRQLQVRLSEKERTVQALQTDNLSLSEEISTLQQEYDEKCARLIKDIWVKNEQIAKARKDIARLEMAIDVLKNTDLKLCGYQEIEKKLKKEIDSLQHEVSDLRLRLASTLGARFKSLMRNILSVHRLTYQALHWVAHALLPATTPPKITPMPIGISLEKALSIIKH